MTRGVGRSRSSRVKGAGASGTHGAGALCASRRCDASGIRKVLVSPSLAHLLGRPTTASGGSRAAQFIIVGSIQSHRNLAVLLELLPPKLPGRNLWSIRISNITITSITTSTSSIRSGGHVVGLLSEHSLLVMFLFVSIKIVQR